MPKYTLEKMFEVWNDQHGDCIEIGPDRDGLDLVELRQKNHDGQISNRIAFSKEEIPLIVEALEELI